MQTKITELVGFCPQCNTPMDVGQCPECGKFVGEVALLTPAIQKKRKRRRRLLYVAASLFIVVQAGWIGYFLEVNVICYLPNALLFPFYGDPDSRATKELVDRFQRGQMSPSDTTKFLDRAAGLYLSCRNPRPAELPVVVKYEACFIGSSFPSYFQYTLGDKFSARIDGRDSSTEAWNESYYLRRGCQLPRLAEGTHKIEFTQELCVPSLDPKYSRPLLLPFSKTVSQSINVIIENRPISDYVKPVWSNEFHDYCMTACVLDVEKRPDAQSMAIHFTFIMIKHDSGMAWSAWIRYRPDTPFIKLSDAVIHQGGVSSHWMPGGKILAKEEQIDSIDLCLIPYPCAAFEERLSNYFAGIIEWSNVPVDVEMHRVHPIEEKRSPEHYPTNIREWNGETEPRPEWCRGKVEEIKKAE